MVERALKSDFELNIREAKNLSLRVLSSDCGLGPLVVKRNGKGVKGGDCHEEHAQGAMVQYSHTAGFCEHYSSGGSLP